jgi:DNA-binding CsgD family transcriptional regulator
VGRIRSSSSDLWDATDAVAGAGLDPVQVLAAGLEAMRAMVSANRADGGFVRRRADVYRPLRVVADDATEVCEVHVRADDELVAAVLGRDRIVTVDDVDSQLPPGSLRAQLCRSRTRSIVVRRLATDDDPFGLVCFDWVDAHHATTPEQLALLDLFISRVLAPLLRQAWAAPPPGPGSAHPLLSPAELAAAELVAEGLTYDEIASALGKSVHTVGHQLASARRKTGARNSMELARALLGPNGRKVGMAGSSHCGPPPRRPR